MVVIPDDRWINDKMSTFEQVFLESLRGEDMFHIVTGPLQAGKSTYCKRLAAKYGVPTIYEYTNNEREGVDVTKDEWWRTIMAYGARNGTNVIETHMSVKDVYPWDDDWQSTPNISNVIQPPPMVQLYFAIPRNYEAYNKRSNELLPHDQLVKVYDYYNDLSKLFPSAKIVR